MSFLYNLSSSILLEINPLLFKMLLSILTKLRLLYFSHNPIVIPYQFNIYLVILWKWRRCLNYLQNHTYLLNHRDFWLYDNPILYNWFIWSFYSFFFLILNDEVIYVIVFSSSKHPISAGYWCLEYWSMLIQLVSS